jgi:hypothetical protein
MAAAMTIVAPAPLTVADLRQWRREAYARMKDAFDRLGKIIASSTGQARVEALARKVLVERRYESALLHMRPMPAWGTAFCEPIARHTSAEIHFTESSAETCRAEASAAHLGTGWWDVACAAP